MINTVNLCYEYSKLGEDGVEKVTTEALKDINLEINDGEFVAILGHNGSGKSTLSKHFNALLLPTKGDVYVLRMNTKNEENVFEIRQSAGMVFQNPDNQIIATIVEEDVAFGLENLGIEPSLIRERVDKALQDVSMQDYKKHAPHFLSGGQKQRVAIAGILAMKPKCIILDEATAMLDPIGRKEVLDIALKLNKEEKISIILITHFMDEASLADKVYVLSKGKIVKSGSPKEVFSDVPKLYELGLGVSQITKIAHNLQEMGIPLENGILTVDEMVGAVCRLLKK